MTTQLPHGWIWASPAELASPEKHVLGIGPFGSDLKVTDYTDGGVPLVFVRNIRAGSFLLPNQPMVSVEKAAQLLAHRVVPGDVLITKMGEPPGDAAVYPEHAPEGRMTADCIRLRVNANVATAKFVMYATHSPVVKDQILSETKGVAQKKISLERFRTVRYPLPALPEQHRIVAAIETHFSRLDAAVASLTRAKANVKRARASVLKAAVEGRLVPTEAALARTEGRDYEPAATLLARVVVERKAAWTASGAKGKYKEPVAPETEGLPELPEGWRWTCMDALTAVTGGIAKNASRGTRDVSLPFLRVANVYADELRLDDVTEIQVSNSELPGFLVERDDLLIVEGNGSPEHLGRVALWSAVIAPCVHQNHLIKARSHGETHPRWLLHWLLSPNGRVRILATASSTSGLHTLSISKVKALQVPLPPLAEQHRIVAEVDRRLSVLDTLDTTLDANLARCKRLRQSILKRAFEGRLVPAEAPHDQATSKARAPQLPLFEGAAG